MNADNIFKFVSLRPPKIPTKSVRSKFVTSPTKSEFFETLRSTASYDDAVKASKKVMTSKGYNPDVSKLNEAVKAATMMNKVSEVNAHLEKTLGSDPKKYLGQQEAILLATQLWDSLYAQVVLPDEHPKDRENIYNGIRSLHYLKLMSQLKESDKPLSWKEYLQIRPTIDKEIVPVDDEEKSKKREEFQKVKDKTLADLKILHGKLNSYKSAVNNLKNIGRTFRAEEQRKVALEDVNVSQFGAELVQSYKLVSLDAPTVKKSLANVSFMSKEKDTGGQSPQMAIKSTSVIIPSKKPWVFADFGKKNLSPNTLNLLNSFKEDLSEKEDIEIRVALESKMTKDVKNFFLTVPKSLFKKSERHIGQCRKIV